MATVTIVGLGPGPLSLLTLEAKDELLRAEKVFFRTGSYPAFAWLRDLGKTVVPFDTLYGFQWQHPTDKYKFMTEALLKEAVIRGQAVYAVPGSPFVSEDTTMRLQIRGAEAGVGIKVVGGMSYIDCALASLNFDTRFGLQVVMETHVRSKRFSHRLAMLVSLRGKLQHDLLETYPPDHLVTLLWTEGLPAWETKHKVIALADLDREHADREKFFASLFVPPVDPDRKTSPEIWAKVHRQSPVSVK